MNPDLLQRCLGELPDALDLLVLASGPRDQVKQWLFQAYPSCSGEPEIHSLADGVDDVLQQRRWPLVCLLLPNSADNADKAAVTKLLARLRDLHADKVIHVERRSSDPASEDNGWTLADSLALGYMRCRVVLDGATKFDIFEFDIRTYKPAPDWLNSRHWANPEQWDKHHW